MSKKQEEVKKSPTEKPKKGTTGTTHGSYDVHPVSGKDQRLPANTGGPLSGDGIHSGVAIPQQLAPVASGAAEAPFNPAALEEGMKNSIGTSASGTHKDMPKASQHPAAQPGVTSPRGTKYHERTGDAAREEGLSKEGFRCVKK